MVHLYASITPKYRSLERGREGTEYFTTIQLRNVHNRRDGGQVHGRLDPGSIASPPAEQPPRPEGSARSDRSAPLEYGRPHSRGAAVRRDSTAAR